ncbi:hypothetical protein BKA69DRAFT_23059 [Paraphysoderma sedebokerense]|nr:hypothetical protein BKA69DRAFT_23059 [Paraphysoderma sedebokerense]
MSPPHDTIRLPEPHMVDMVKIVEAKVDILEKEKEELLLRATDFESEIQLYREQITNREQEIARLGALLETSRAQSFVTGGVSGITSAKNSRVEQLEMQVEYLQEHVQSLESDLSQAANKRNDKMEELERQKHNIEMELENAKEKNAKLIKSLERLEKTINSLRGKGSPSKVASSPDVSTSGQKSRSVKIQSSVNPEVSGLVDDLQEELATMEELLHTTTDQHTLLKTDFDSKLDIIGVKNSIFNKHTIEIHQENAKLHDELRQLRETISSLQNQTLGSNAPSTASASLTTTTNLDSDVNQLKTKLQSLETTKWTLESEVKSLRQKLEQALKHTQDLESSQSTVQNMHRDLKESKGEIHMWVDKVQEMEKERQKLLTAQRSIEAKLQDMTRERNDLLQSLQQFDSQLKTFQDQIVDITRDRDNFQALYKQVY